MAESARDRERLRRIGEAKREFDAARFPFDSALAAAVAEHVSRYSIARLLGWRSELMVVERGRRFRAEKADAC